MNAHADTVRQTHKIRVALMTHTIDGRSASGTALVARKWIETLLEHRGEFDLTFVHFERSDEPIYSHGVPEVIFPLFRWQFLNRRFFRQTYYFLTTKDSFDIMQWFQPRMYPLFWLAPARHIVVTVHGAGDVRESKITPFIFSRFIFNWTLRLFRNKVSAAIAGSHFSKSDILAAYRFKPGQVHVINNGVDPTFGPASPEQVAAVKRKYALPEKFFLGVARLIPNKNVLRAFRAFLIFSREHEGEGIHFVNIGAKGSQRPQADALIAASGVADRFHLISYVENEDLPAMYSAAYALVLPVLNEGFTLPAIEGMACGAPAIIPRTAAPEITEHDAMLVDVFDERNIASAMAALTQDPALRSRLTEKGLAKARTFTWEASGRKLIELYERLVPGR